LALAALDLLTTQATDLQVKIQLLIQLRHSVEDKAAAQAALRVVLLVVQAAVLLMQAAQELALHKEIQAVQLDTDLLVEMVLTQAVKALAAAVEQEQWALMELLLSEVMEESAAQIL
jgi:hypothetical protein